MQRYLVSLVGCERIHDISYTFMYSYYKDKCTEYCIGMKGLHSRTTLIGTIGAQSSLFKAKYGNFKEYPLKFCPSTKTCDKLYCLNKLSNFPIIIREDPNFGKCIESPEFSKPLKQMESFGI